MKLQQKITLEYGGLLKHELLEKINASGILLNAYAQEILQSDAFKVSKQWHKITLVKYSVKELGFVDGATLLQIRESIKRIGLSECPLEVALYLRLMIRNQEEIPTESKNITPADSLTVISKPISEADNFPKGFYLRKINGELWLRGYCCSLDYVWNPNDELIISLNNSRIEKPETQTS